MARRKLREAAVHDALAASGCGKAAQSDTILLDDALVRLKSSSSLGPA
jgi:hypothetical protein